MAFRRREQNLTTKTSYTPTNKAYESPCPSKTPLTPTPSHFRPC